MVSFEKLVQQFWN